MLTKLHLIPATLAFGVAVTALDLAAVAAPTVRAADQVEQRVIDDLAQGDDALASGHRQAALVAIEQAQTTLLNAEQASTYRAPLAIEAIETAHADVLQGKLPAAAGLVHSAEAHLKTPAIG